MKNNSVTIITILCMISANMIKSHDWFDNYLIEKITEEASELKKQNKRLKNRIKNINDYHRLVKDIASVELLQKAYDEECYRLTKKSKKPNMEELVYKNDDYIYLDKRRRSLDDERFPLREKKLGLELGTYAVRRRAYKDNDAQQERVLDLLHKAYLIDHSSNTNDLKEKESDSFQDKWKKNCNDGVV